MDSHPVARAKRQARPGWLDRLVENEEVAWFRLRELGAQERSHLSERATYILDDAIRWLTNAPRCSIHAVVTDPPYSLIEYEEKNHGKLRVGRGGVWRIPPTFDGANRKPLPRFTVLSQDEMYYLRHFFSAFAAAALSALVPGGHLFIASNPLLSTVTFDALREAGFQKRGEVIRLVQTLRGGDRPKGAEKEFADVSVMPRSCWEPWGIFRKPFTRTVVENLREWGAGGLRRVSESEPFKDVIVCSPTRGKERAVAPHPSLKPQRFLRQVVRASLPLGIGIVYDPFAGSGSTLAAAEAVGYRSIGTDRDHQYFEMARHVFSALATMPIERAPSARPVGVDYHDDLFA
ncbi:MAG: DNA-methyltransferase [Geminicoccaceae bacterium]